MTNITSSQAMFGYEKRDDVKKAADSYTANFNSGKTDSKEAEDRRKNYMSMVTSFYNLVTEFYEYGWGQSFHFAPRHQAETFESSIARQEYYVALR